MAKTAGALAQFASAVARANSFASDDEARLVYPDRRWEWAFIGKGWFTLFRFYGPLEPFFDKTWKPGDIEAST